MLRLLLPYTTDTLPPLTNNLHNLETVKDRVQVLITDRKLHMGFQLIPKSMTLNDLERRNDHRPRYLCGS